MAVRTANVLFEELFFCNREGIFKTPRRLKTNLGTIVEKQIVEECFIDFTVNFSY